MGTLRKMLTLVILSFIYSVQSTAQCTTSILSTDGYTVEITLNPVGIVAPNTCPFGYNFNVVVDYEISFLGPNQPANLYFLNANVGCGSLTSNFLELPETAGTGTVTTTVNPYNSNTDCATATVNSLMCDNLTINLGGPGIRRQSVSCGMVVPIELTYFSVSPANGLAQIE